MDYPIKLPGFEQRELIWRTGTWKNTLLEDGVVVTGGGKRKNEYRIKDDKGEEKVIIAHSSFGDSVPVIEHDGERLELAPPISTAQKVVAGILFAPLLAGGAVGGLFAGIGWGLSLANYRSKSPPWLQYVKVIASAGVAWFVYLMIAVGVQSMVG